MASQFIIDKAARLIENDAVEPVPEAQLYCVTGENGVYNVLLHDDGEYECSCEAVDECSHGVAAQFIDKRTTAREAAWETASKALRILLNVIEDEDLPDYHVPDPEDIPAGALKIALDHFDRAHDIDHQED